MARARDIRNISRTARKNIVLSYYSMIDLYSDWIKDIKSDILEIPQLNTRGVKNILERYSELQVALSSFSQNKRITLEYFKDLSEYLSPDFKQNFLSVYRNSAGKEFINFPKKYQGHISKQNDLQRTVE